METAGAEENKMVNQTAEKKRYILKLIYKHLNFIKAEITKIQNYGIISLEQYKQNTTCT